MKKPETVQYGVWTIDPTDEDMSCWAMYDSIEEAVSSEGDETVVYKLEATKVGTFKLHMKLERVTKPKRSKKSTK